MLYDEKMKFSSAQSSLAYILHTYNTTIELKVFLQDTDFVSKYPFDNELFIAVQSSNISELVDWRGNTDKQEQELFEGFVFISKVGSRKQTARKIIAYSSFGLDKQHAMLGYRTMKQLGLKEYDPIYVEPINYIKYLWYHPYASSRIAYRISVVSLFVGLLSLVVSLFINHINF